MVTAFRVEARGERALASAGPAPPRTGSASRARVDVGPSQDWHPLMGCEYHDGMSVPRQGDPATGRVNQKRRTRAAIVEAAKELIGDGTTPTVAQAAEVALVSRTTAYRYFPTQESLLLEVAVNVDVDEIEALVARPVDRAGAAERAIEILRLLNTHVLAAEVQYRTSSRLYLDMWLAAMATGDPEPVVREGRRRRWFATVLAPWRSEVDPAELDRLVAALSMLAGIEGIIVLRDVCQLDGPAALDVAEWAARSLLARVLPPVDPVSPR
jgi:AcrR family transcriptional regulator